MNIARVVGACFHVACVMTVMACAACGDDDAPIETTHDAGIDATQPRGDSGSAPSCGQAHCGSPLVGEHCCTTTTDVTEGAAVSVNQCGVDLGALVTGLRGRCVQLRQPGTLDTACPALMVGARVEPGCCTSLGLCGTLNQAVELGCQRALSPHAPNLECASNDRDAGMMGDAN